MPNSPRNPNEEFLQGPRIPHAQRWDVDIIAEDSESLGGPKGLGHMMPSKEKFAEACCEMVLWYCCLETVQLIHLNTAVPAVRGIKPTDHVVLYDSVGIFSSPRGWYTFKVCLLHDSLSMGTSHPTDANANPAGNGSRQSLSFRWRFATVSDRVAR